MSIIPSVDLAALLPSWTIALEAERKTPATVATYSEGVRGFLKWCTDTNTTPELTKANVQAFTASLLDAGAQATTARTRQAALKRYAAWLAEEDDIEFTDTLRGLKPPRLDVKVTESLSDDECARLIKACQGREFIDRRDEAIVRLLIETGLRAGEVVALTVDDVNLKLGLAVVRRGKGGKGRVVPFGPEVARAIDKYKRQRPKHRLSHTDALWLGGGNQGFAYHGLNAALKDRAEMAGIKGFHLHLLRHTAATRWLRAGGSEGGLMSVAGWSSRDMLDRYVKASASDRAADESRGLNLGDLGV